LAWHRVPHPSDAVSIGEEIDVYVLELDHDNQRIALSLCRTKPDPWDIVNETYDIDNVVMGKVSNVVDFGAFVVLADGIEGLLHVTEMADGTLTEPYSYLQRGDQVIMKVVRIEPERKRIGFTQSGLDLSKLAEEFERQGHDAIIKPEQVEASPEAEVKVEETSSSTPQQDDEPSQTAA
jgi:small subunit ribosomal protein S1